MTSSGFEHESLDILLVEDNRADVVLLTKAFQSAHSRHRIHVAMDGDTAMAFLHRTKGHHDAPRPALVLLDLNLPGKDGREVLSEIKSDDRLRRIPVVVLTSSDSEDDIVHCYNLHANAYMTKVVSFDDLVEVAKSISGYWLSAVKLPPK